MIGDPIPTRHANMTVRNVGGAIIDLTTVGNPNDQLGCYWPGNGQLRYAFAGASGQARAGQRRSDGGGRKSARTAGRQRGERGVSRRRRRGRPGSYDVIISHGPEHDAVMMPLVVVEGEDAALVATLRRTVDTRGWVSSDFHSHATPSGDNTTSQLGRVQNLLCEQIEFAPCTEHNRVSSYSPLLERLGARADGDDQRPVPRGPSRGGRGRGPPIRRALQAVDQGQG